MCDNPVPINTPSSVLFRTSQKGKSILCFKQKEYHKDKRTHFGSYYRCSKELCRGRGVVKNNLFHITKDHNLYCLPNTNGNPTSGYIPCPLTLPNNQGPSLNSSFEATCKKLSNIPSSICVTNIPKLPYLLSSRSKFVNPSIIANFIPCSGTTSNHHSLQSCLSSPSMDTSNNQSPKLINPSVTVDPEILPITTPTNPPLITLNIPGFTISYKYIKEDMLTNILVPQFNATNGDALLDHDYEHSGQLENPTCTPFEYIKSSKGKDLVYSKHYLFVENKVKKDTIYYRCNDYKCNARGKMHNGLFYISKDHCHGSDKSKYLALRTRNLLKDEMRKYPKNCKYQVYYTVMRNLMNDTRVHNEPNALPTLKSVEKMLKRCVSHTDHSAKNVTE